MAFINYVFCKTCDTYTNHQNGACIKCKKRIEKEEIRKWNSMSIENKIIDINNRLKALENKKVY
ncbi:MAG: hypothetical protein ACOC2U_02755 [bacterium]